MKVDKVKPYSYSGLNALLLLFPFWLLLFYFKEDIARWLIYDAFSFLKGNRLSQTLAFFITTFLKISLLLILIIFIMELIRSWIPMHNIQNRLRSMSTLPANAMAGFFGVLTPFCSCSAVPMFIGLMETGVPLGITFSFLIASPLVNEIILVMLFSLFGFKVAMIYFFAGLSLAIVSGYIIGKLGLEKHLPLWLLTFRNAKQVQQPGLNFDTRIKNALLSVGEIFKRTWLFILAGIAVGAVIHGYVPDNWLQNIMSGDKWYTMPLAVLTGIPLYACSASIAPVAFSLVDKGMPLGTALAFIMAVAGLSFPELMMLKKVLSFRLILIFAGILLTGIMMVGFLFNLIF